MIAVGGFVILGVGIQRHMIVIVHLAHVLATGLELLSIIMIHVLIPMMGLAIS